MLLLMKLTAFIYNKHKRKLKTWKLVGIMLALLNIHRHNQNKILTICFIRYKIRPDKWKYGLHLNRFLRNRQHLVSIKVVMMTFNSLTMNLIKIQLQLCKLALLNKLTHNIMNKISKPLMSFHHPITLPTVFDKHSIMNCNFLSAIPKT